MKGENETEDSAVIHKKIARSVVNQLTSEKNTLFFRLYFLVIIQNFLKEGIIILRTYFDAVLEWSRILKIHSTDLKIISASKRYNLTK